LRKDAAADAGLRCGDAEVWSAGGGATALVDEEERRCENQVDILDGMVPLLSGSELGAGRDWRVSDGTDALSCEPCRWGMGRWFSAGESYVDVEPDRTVLGEFCHELDESCERRRE
jgi:hypothetical protein